MSQLRTVLALAGIAVASSVCYYYGGPHGYYGPGYYHHPLYYWHP